MAAIWVSRETSDDPWQLLAMIFFFDDPSPFLEPCWAGGCCLEQPQAVATRQLFACEPICETCSDDTALFQTRPSQSGSCSFPRKFRWSKGSNFCSTILKSVSVEPKNLRDLRKKNSATFHAVNLNDNATNGFLVEMVLNDRVFFCCTHGGKVPKAMSRTNLWDRQDAMEAIALGHLRGKNALWAVSHS